MGTFLFMQQETFIKVPLFLFQSGKNIGIPGTSANGTIGLFLIAFHFVKGPYLHTLNMEIGPAFFVTEGQRLLFVKIFMANTADLILFYRMPVVHLSGLCHFFDTRAF